MINLHILCGIPASGKSTWAKAQIAKSTFSAIRISRDEIRFHLLKPNEDYFSKENEVFAQFIEEIKSAIKSGYHDIYVDATHINYSSRHKVLKAIGSVKLYSVNLIYDVFCTSMQTALDRNSKRTGRALVPAEAIDSMFRAFVLPTWTEGDDEMDNFGYISYEVNMHE